MVVLTSPSLQTDNAFSIQSRPNKSWTSADRPTCVIMPPSLRRLGYFNTNRIRGWRRGFSCNFAYLLSARC